MSGNGGFGGYGYGGYGGKGASSGRETFCGDGFIDADEECDDANDQPNDGCTSCVIDCPFPGTKSSSNAHCYQLFEDATTWPLAEANCEAWGGQSGLGHLVSIGDATEQGFVSTFIAQDTWIGGGDMVVEGTFTWVDGTPFSFTNWAPGKPDDMTVEDCMFTRANGWDDNDCGQQKTAYLCERRGAGNF